MTHIDLHYFHLDYLLKPANVSTLYTVFYVNYKGCYLHHMDLHSQKENLKRTLLKIIKFELLLVQSTLRSYHIPERSVPFHSKKQDDHLPDSDEIQALFLVAR